LEKQLPSDLNIDFLEALFVEQPNSLALWNIWQIARADKPLPTVQDMEKSGIETIYADLSIFSVPVPTQQNVLQMSRLLKTITGIDRTGLNLVEHTERHNRRPKIETSWRLVKRPCGLSFLAVLPAISNKFQYYRAEALMLPVDTGGKFTSRLLYTAFDPELEPTHNVLVAHQEVAIPPILRRDFIDLGFGTDPVELPSLFS